MSLFLLQFHFDSKNFATGFIGRVDDDDEDRMNESVDVVRRIGGGDGNPSRLITIPSSLPLLSLLSPLQMMLV
jgi:hypothetical protein